jgi:hypothetical protein
MTDMAFRGRAKVAVLKFAQHISGEAPGAAEHNTRVRWAQNAMTQPDVKAMQVQPVAVMMDQVQNAGANVSDDDLQL